MERYFNRHYSYDDMDMWQDETWKGREEPIHALLEAANRLILAEREKNPVPEYYPERTDEVRDKVHRCAYFPDVIEAWREKGLVFTCSGMMGLTMAPVSVIEHRKRDVKVLYVPEVTDGENPHLHMNILKHYESLLERCAKEEILVSFLPIPFTAKIPILEKFQETQGNYRTDFDHVYLDLTLLKSLGFSMDMVPNAADYKPETEIGGVAALDISDKWAYHIAHQYIISRLYWETYPDWDYEQHIHTAVGKYMAESMRIERDYDHPEDPRLLEKWRQKGLRYENHFTQKELWVTLTPESAFEQPEEKLPLLCIFKEPRTSAPFMMQTGMQFYYQFLDLAAQGQFIALFFAMEQPDDNDLLVDIIRDAQEIYPIDPERIYLTGQSHNGYYGLEFYRRHPKLIAAAATLADPFGMEIGATVRNTETPEFIESFTKYDMPLININGNLENKYYTAQPGSELEKKNAVYFQRRLKAFRCPEKTVEEIIAARSSEDYATRKNGIPADRTEVRFVMGNEAYVSDLKNMDGKWHLRMISIENLPHMIAPQMAELAWEFMRRFARDRRTGEIKERF